MLSTAVSTLSAQPSGTIAPCSPGVDGPHRGDGPDGARGHGTTNGANSDTEVEPPPGGLHRSRLVVELTEVDGFAHGRSLRLPQ